MPKRITPEERAKQEVINRCLDLLERLRQASETGLLPDELRIDITGVWSSGERATVFGERVVIPKPISYITPGRLSGKVQGHEISVSNDGEGHFRAVVNGKPRHPLSSTFVEEELKIPVHRKKSGSQTGYPSEPVPRAVWRRLMQRYNSGDPTVHYERTTE